MRAKYKTRADGRKCTSRTYEHFGLADFSGRKSFYGKTDAEVDSKIAEFEKSLTEHFPAEKTMKYLCWQWFEDKEIELSPNSKSSYRAKLKDIEEEFGELHPAQITTVSILQWLRKKSAQGFSQKSISGRKSVLKLVLDAAVAEGLIDSNPCASVPTVKGKSAVKRHSASDSDLAKIEEHKTDSLIARMFYFMEYTGCRIGECVVLQEKDIDREGHKAKIYKDLAYESQEPIVKNSAKTDAGHREIDLYDNVLEILPKYKNPNTYIFFPDGLPNKSPYETALKKFRKDIGITATAHQLRHSYAGLMHSAEVDVKDTQARLGHSSIVMTQDVYTEIERKHNEKIRNKVNRYIMEERLGGGLKHCKNCGSRYIKADDGHEFKYCPDCGKELP